MMALGIVKIYLGSPFLPISVVRGQFVSGQLVRGQFVAVSCRGPKMHRWCLVTSRNLFQLHTFAKTKNSKTFQQYCQEKQTFHCKN